MAARIEPARPSDVAAIEALLTESQLPLAGFRHHVATALVARDSDAVIGGVELEVYPDGGLLRSVAVSRARQHQGIGEQLIVAAIQLAVRLEIQSLFLLTTTAARYFPRFGFEAVERADVPLGVQRSIEFRSACPASATVMRRILSR
jgi:amino-acid N-acetyltransferase